MRSLFIPLCLCLLALVITMPQTKAAMPAPEPLAADDIFLPYVKSVPTIATVVSEEVADGVQVIRLRFTSAEGTKEGAVQPSEVYAVLARPATPPTGKRPGILACHGGGGSAAEGSAIAWAKLGYVSVAPDFPGYGAKEKLQSITRTQAMNYGDGRFTVTPTPYANVLFDAVVSGLGAFNLLESQPDVDRSRLGITGISWGGYMTTMLSGLLGERVFAAFDLYGSGFYQIDAIGTDILKKMPDNERETWVKCFDAGTRLHRARATFLMYSATNDAFFKPPSVMATLDTVPCAKYLCFSPNKSHWISLPGGSVSWSSPMTTAIEPAYFAHVFAGNNPPLPELEIIPTPAGSKTVAFRVKNMPADAQPFFYASWNIDSPWQGRDWAQLNAISVKNGVYTCDVPDALPACDWFGGISFTLKAGKLQSPISLSTRISNYRAE